MSAKVLREEFMELTSGAGQVEGPAFLLGGNPWDVQFVAPAALCGMEGSMDKLNWETMNDMFNVPIGSPDTLGSVMRVGLERPKWLRFVVATDVSEPRIFSAIVAVGKEQGG
jgi:hypothetical protein